MEKIHKAAFFWNAEKKRQQLIACGKSDHRQFPLKSNDWDEVTCKDCLLAKDSLPVSTVNLL